MALIEISLVVASQVQQKLAEFYGSVLGVNVQKGLTKSHCFILYGETRIEFYRPSQNRLKPIKGSSQVICLKGPSSNDPISSLKEWSSKLVSKGGSVISEPSLEPFGGESCMADPEGNYFLIFVPNLFGG